ncbi:efflux RND transporter periplasmic adaptor subunit [Arcobacter sp. YIC-310]|uniref:efflux RND transporter periplasmic adaptor subunit n=1 Tax=Arcobacter sp. YIC-310 TaxID=3376632 RepID=UPI003C15852D
MQKYYIKSAIFLSLFIFTSLNAKIIEVEQLFNRKTVKVKQEEVSITKSFYGKMAIDESKVVDVVTRFDGFVTNLNANKTFMKVNKNDELFQVYSDEIYSIQKELQIAKRVNKSLYLSTMERLKALDINKKELQKIKNAKLSYEGIKVYSPMNSIVLQKNINDKGAIKKGNLLMQLANIEKLWFIANIYQKDLGFLKDKMEALVYVDGLTTPIKTKLDYIYPNVDEKDKSIDVRFVVDNKDLKLYPNMFGTIKLKSTQKKMLTLPKTTVLSKGSEYYVFKPISKKEFEPVKVEAKRLSSYKYEILDGLEEGDEVINNALFLLDSDAITNALYDSDTDDDW